MTTADEVKAEFLGKLKSLLNEYKAEICVEDENRFGYCSDYQIHINIPAVYSDGETLAEYCDIRIGRWFCHD